MGDKEKKHKEKKDKKEKKRSREEEGGGVEQRQHQHEEQNALHTTQKDSDKPLETPGMAAVDASGKKKKHRSSAAADGDGSSWLIAPGAGGPPAAPPFNPLRDADTTLAAFRHVKPPGGPDQLQPCWPLEGTVAVAKAPLVPMRRVLEGKAELWVVQLPAQLDLSTLDGCTLRLDEAVAADPGRSGAMGRLEIAKDAAVDLELVRAFSLRQEAAAAAADLFVAAPTERSGGDLEVLRAARRVVLSEDVGAANGLLVEGAHAERPELQFYPEFMAPRRAGALLQQEKRFHLPPATPPAGTWPPPGWAPSAALQERDRRRAARKKRGLPEIDPQDDLEQQQLTDLRPAAGAPWGSAGGAALPPQWRELPGGAPQEAYLGDVEQDVSISYRYG